MAWGFPRPPSPEELSDQAHWFRYRDIVVVWLEPTLYTNAWGVHYAVNPAHRRKFWPAFKVWREVQEEAWELSGRIEGLLVALHDRTKASAPYLSRLGFERDPESGLWVCRYGTQEWVSTLERSLVLS